MKTNMWDFAIKHPVIFSFIAVPAITGVTTVVLKVLDAFTEDTPESTCTEDNSASN